MSEIQAEDINFQTRVYNGNTVTINKLKEDLKDGIIIWTTGSGASPSGNSHYKDDLGFLENHKYFQIITPEGRTRYMIFAFMDVPKNSYIYDVVGADPDNMREFLDTIEYKTYIDTGIEPTVDDKIITLSTCTRSDTLFFVMFAVEVE